MQIIFKNWGRKRNLKMFFCLKNKKAQTIKKNTDKFHYIKLKYYLPTATTAIKRKYKQEKKIFGMHRINKS